MSEQQYNELITILKEVQSQLDTLHNTVFILYFFTLVLCLVVVAAILLRRKK